MKCQLCSQSASLKFQKHLGYQASQTYDIYHCSSCQTAFALPLKIDGQLYDLIYRQAAQIPGYDRYLTYATQVLQENNPLNYLAQSEDIYWAIQHYLKQRAGETLKILEVGCGFGYLTYALAQAGYHVQGIDISQVAIDQAIQRYGHHFICADIHAYAQQAGPSYDLIIFTEVIEHIEDVKSFLKAADDLLLPEGNLLMTTPNKTPYPSDILWETEPPPVHLWWFSEQSMVCLAQNLGHQVTFVDLNDFNLKEVNEFGDYFKPYTLIGEFQPSRLPRLDSEGSLLAHGHHVAPPYVPPPLDSKLSFKSLLKMIKKMIKKTLHAVHLLALYQKYKEKYRIYKLKKYLKEFPQRRPTLCAVFQKSAGNVLKQGSASIY